MSEDQATRGGMWDDRFTIDFHCAYREVANRLSQDDDLGFRIAKHEGRPRTLRSGSWYSLIGRSLCAIRLDSFLVSRYGDIGFRIARRKS